MKTILCVNLLVGGCVCVVVSAFQPMHQAHTTSVVAMISNITSGLFALLQN